MMIRLWPNLQQYSRRNLHRKNRPDNHNPNPQSKKCNKYVPLAKPCDCNSQKRTHYRMNNRRCHLRLTIPNPVLPLPRLTLVLMHNMRTLIHRHTHRHEQVDHSYTVQLHTPPPYTPTHNKHYTCYVGHHYQSCSYVVEY